ncbi:MAG: NfeD family protein [Planctomycetota bacterium]
MVPVKTAAAGAVLMPVLWLGTAAGVLQETDSPTAPAAPAVPAYRQANTVAVLTVQGPIDKVTWRSLERRVQQALDDGADALVLDIDTPGGALEATLEICHLIKTDAPANTVAWINPQAYSAGTIIALACREIVVARNASFGDAAPISSLGVPIPITERAKLESPILAEVIDSARRHHYDENLVQSFVSVGVELWLIQHVDTGERVFVDREEYRAVFGEDPAQQLTRVAPPAGAAPSPVRPWFSTLIPVDQSPGEPPPDAEKLKAEIEFQQQLFPARTRLTEVDSGKWRPVAQVVSGDRLLTLKPAEAIYYGLAVTTVANDADLAAYFGATTLRRYDRTWSESLVRFLVNPVVRGVLIVIFVVCLVIELAAPGFGIFGSAAVATLLLLVGAPWLAGMAGWWELVAIMAGLVLIAAELFVIPGFGLPGLAGVVCLLVGLVGTFISGDINTPRGQEELWTGLGAVLTAIFAAGIAIWLISKNLNAWPLLNRIVLRAEIGGAGPVGGRAAGGAAAAEAGPRETMGAGLTGLRPGDVGVAETDLRPAGRANFDGRLVDVKSIGSYIEQGTPIRVATVGRFVIEVEEAAS